MATDYRRLFLRSLLALSLGSVVVALCYFFIDPPVARAVHGRDHSLDWLLKALTLPPPVIEAWVPAVLVALALRRAFGPLTRWERTLLAASVAVVLADQFRESLSMVFGRSWPETWIDDNSSLIRDGDSAFHFFDSGAGGSSFPSGHTARMAALVAPFWLAYRWTRPVGVLVVLLTAVGLVGMNYHYVGDVVAGGLIGFVVGSYAAAVADLTPASPQRRGP